MSMNASEYVCHRLQDSIASTVTRATQLLARILPDTTR
jgi:hypothetical protein